MPNIKRSVADFAGPAPEQCVFKLLASGPSQQWVDANPARKAHARELASKGNSPARYWTIPAD
jgi:hypothetical protein